MRRRLKAPGPIGFTGVINPGAVTRPSCCKREVFAGLDPIVLKQAVQSSKIAAMPDSDAWEDVQSPRRGAKRYRARWKASIVFDDSPGKPVFQTLTHDLSMNGTSLQSDTDEKIHSVLTLLLLPPPIDGTAQRIIRLKSVVMSSTPFRGGFRLGLSFVQDPELDKLRALIGKLDLSGDSLPSDPEEGALPKLF